MGPGILDEVAVHGRTQYSLLQEVSGTDARSLDVG
jgi:hypothetical protein